MIWRYSRKGLQISPKSDTLIFYSKTAWTIYLVYGLKLALNMTFNLTETYFSEKFAIWRYLTAKSSKIALIEVFGHFLDFASLVFPDFAHNDRWAWCLVVFLQIAGPVNVFLFLQDNQEHIPNFTCMFSILSECCGNGFFNSTHENLWHEMHRFGSVEVHLSKNERHLFCVVLSLFHNFWFTIRHYDVQPLSKWDWTIV